MEDAVKQGKEQGYAKTLFNRRRGLPEINSGKQGVHIMELTEKAYGSRVGAV